MGKFLITYEITRKINRKGDTITETKTEFITLPTSPKLPQYNVTEFKTEKDIAILEKWIENRDFNAEQKKVTLRSFSELKE